MCSHTTTQHATSIHSYTVAVTPKIDSEDLIDVGEVTTLLGLSHKSAVSLYQSRYPDMPRPVVVKSGGKTLLWLRSEMLKWAKQTGRIS